MDSIFFLSVMNGSAWGGSEETWYQSALWLARNNYKVGICVFNWPGKKEKINQLKDVGCTLYLLPGKKETKSVWGKWKLRKKFKKVPFHNYDKVIINQGGWKDVTYQPFKNLYKNLPDYSLTFHNYDLDAVLSSKRVKTLKKWINNASENLAASKNIFILLNDLLSIDIPSQKILLNPNTFEAPSSVIPVKYNKDNKIIFTMLAALEIVRKAQDILIKSLSKEKWKNRNWELHLYGEGKDKALLQKIINVNKLQSNIFLKGYSGNVKEVLIESDLVLQITHKDAMPISVTEAMSIGRPVVVSNVGDMPAWIEDGVNGWVVNEISEQAIDQTLEKAWTEREKWPEMGKKSFEMFHKKYPENPVLFFLQQCKILK